MSIPSWAHVGADVVCIVSYGWEFDDDSSDATGPSYGEICRVVSVKAAEGSVWLRLCGYVGKDDEFQITGFRPLVSLDQDISTYFQHLLDVPANQKADA